MNRLGSYIAERVASAGVNILAGRGLLYDFYRARQHSHGRSDGDETVSAWGEDFINKL